MKTGRAAEGSVVWLWAVTGRGGPWAVSLWLLRSTRESRLSPGNRPDLIIQTRNTSWFEASACFSHSPSLTQTEYSQREIYSTTAHTGAGKPP